MASSETDLLAPFLSEVLLNNSQSTVTTTPSAYATLTHEVSAVAATTIVAEEVLSPVISDLELKQAPDPRWPYLNRAHTGASSDFRSISTVMVEAGSGVSPTVTVEGSSGVSPTVMVEVDSSGSAAENAEDVDLRFGLVKDASTDLTILAPPAISDNETAELPSTGSLSLSHELNDVVEKSPPTDSH
ncbi:hypothetical protein Bca4012_094635 [Brassica carinata]